VNQATEIHSQLRCQLVALDHAITDANNNSAGNPGGVAVLGLTVSNPPTQAEVQAVANKLDELLAALRRT
jgi:hypothetical protein